METFGFEDLTVSLGSTGRVVAATGSLKAGGVMRVAGPSGVGKTTLLRAMARLVGFDSGTIRLDGEHHGSLNPQAWRRRIHYNAQAPAVHGGDAYQNVTVPHSLKGMSGLRPPTRDEVGGHMRALGLAVPPDHPAESLSGGELARMALLRACLSGCEVLLLDEPTASLDPDSRRQVLGYLRDWMAEGGRAMVIISHNDGDFDAFDNPVTVVPKCMGGGVA